MAATWGPRWHTVAVEYPPGGDSKAPPGLRRIERVDGSAARPGGTWSYLERYLADRQNIPPGGIRNGSNTLPPSGGNGSGVLGPPWPASLGLSLEQIRKQLRLRIRARVAAKLVSQKAEDVAEREARITTTAADVVAYREARGWSQYDLAAAAGLSRSYVAECERGRRTGLRVREWVDGQRVGVS
jgi:hypothetical protein